MGYNLKIIRTSSYVEVWEYEHEIASDYSLPQKEAEKKIDTISFEESTEEEQLNRLKGMAKTRQNAKWTLLRLIDTNFDDKTSFLTLTTKENITNRNEFNKLFDKFITRLNYNVFGLKKRIIKYIAVLERQNRGSWHAHILLFDFPYVPHHKLLKIWKHGAVRINKVDVDSIDNRGRYVVKYFEKGIGQELLDSMGKKSFYASRTIKKLDVTKTKSDADNIFNDQEVIIENEFNAKYYKDGEFKDNKVIYKKYKI
ncbi:rolling circle replication-associated protein [Macrococcus capreoli]|uniref:rolling circle replication-associated protein n=1 Tax=Macrococcus capreoli TaxID=2982690 RepID=UPI002A27101C|nr:Rep protein [Macrococcus sp. TMW 2.2395]